MELISAHGIKVSGIGRWISKRSPKTKSIVLDACPRIDIHFLMPPEALGSGIPAAPPLIPQSKAKPASPIVHGNTKLGLHLVRLLWSSFPARIFAMPSYFNFSPGLSYAKIHSCCLLFWHKRKLFI